MRLRVGVVMAVLLGLLALVGLSGCTSAPQIDYYHAPTNATPVAQTEFGAGNQKTTGVVEIILPMEMNLSEAKINVPGEALCPNQPTELTVDSGWYAYLPRSMSNINRLKFGRAEGKETIIRAHDARYNWYTAEYEYEIYRLGPIVISHELFVMNDQSNHAWTWERIRDISGKYTITQTCL